MPEIHGANKGLDLHVQLGKQRPFPSLPIQTVDKGPPTHPIPKPRIGQGKARLKRKVKTPQPISVACSANNRACSKNRNAIT